MKGLSVIFTIVLFVVAFLLANYLKQTGKLPVERQAPQEPYASEGRPPWTPGAN